MKLVHRAGLLSRALKYPATAAALLFLAATSRAQPAALSLQTQPILTQDFEAATGNGGARDDSAWAGGRVPLRVVDSGDARRGKVLEATTSGYAQISLGEFNLEEGQAYRVSLEMSSRGTQEVEVGLRTVGDPYTMHSSITTQIFEQERAITFLARAKAGNPSRLQLVMRGTTTLAIDNIHVEKVTGGLPEGFQPDDPAGMLLASQPPTPENLILNSGFELGRDGFFSRGAVEFARDPQAFEGRRILKLAGPNAEATSTWQKLSVHFDYQIVARVKAVGGPARVGLAWGDYVNFRGGVNGKGESFEVRPEDGWKRVAWTWRPSPTRGQVDPYRLYYLALANRSDGGANAPQVWVDAVQARVVGGDAEQIKNGRVASADDPKYLPRRGTELGITTSVPYNVATVGEDVQVQVLSTSDRPALLQVLDEQGQVARTLRLSFRSFRDGEARATLSKLGPGYWKLTTAPPDRTLLPRTEGESFLTVVPAMPTVPLDRWHFGSHIRADEAMQLACWKLGWRWNRMHDTSGASKWPSVQPSRDEWKWDDEHVRRLERPAAGVKFGLLGSLDRVPAWVPKAGDNPNREAGTEVINADSMSLWSDYCRRTAERWKGIISHWEVTNEPNLSGMSAEHYRQVLEAAYQGVKAGNPDAVVVGLGGAVPPGSPWLANVIKAGGWRSAQAFSFHNYGGTTWGSQSGPGNIRAAIEGVRTALREAGATSANAPILDTESGLIVRSVYSKYLQPYGDSDPREAARMMPKAVASVLASGLSRWFYYASFETSHPGENAAFTAGDVNNSLKMPFQPMAVAISQLEGRAFGGDDPILPAGSKGAFAMRFGARGGAGSEVTLAWSNEAAGTAVALPRGARVLSMWGRTLKIVGPLKLTSEPVYIVRPQVLGQGTQ